LYVFSRSGDGLQAGNKSILTKFQVEKYKEKLAHQQI
jgi:hypothetical protein